MMRVIENLQPSSMQSNFPVEQTRLCVRGGRGVRPLWCGRPGGPARGQCVSLMHACVRHSMKMHMHVGC
eukprot:359948-Chlamydomonas_euryale.AAC.5